MNAEQFSFLPKTLIKKHVSECLAYWPTPSSVREMRSWITSFPFLSFMTSSNLSDCKSLRTFFSILAMPVAKKMTGFTPPPTPMRNSQLDLHADSTEQCPPPQYSCRPKPKLASVVSSTSFFRHASLSSHFMWRRTLTCKNESQGRPCKNL